MARSLQFHAPDRAAWTAWLEQHHAAKQEVFLVFYRKAAGRPTISYDEAVEEALCFGWIDGVKHKLDERRYTYRFTPRRPGSVWSDINKARIERLAAAAKIRPAGQAAIELARSNGAWTKPARAVMPEAMPPELATGLAKSARARRAYETATPRAQRDWQRWIHQAKQAETRIRRAAQAIAALEGRGPHPWARKPPAARPAAKRSR